MIISLVGGTGTFIGPIVGAFIYIFVEHFVTSFFQHWMLVFGIIVMACVLAFRGGVAPYLIKLINLIKGSQSA